MKRVLSIDWDYFINATAEQRAFLFPDGVDENLDSELQKLCWDNHYNSSLGEQLKNIGVVKNDYETIHSILRKFSHKNSRKEDLIQVAISHKWIYYFIMKRISEGEEFEVYNLDFHHDMYCYKTRDEEVNCGNWVNCLLEKRPDMKYYWVKREDSETEVLGGEVDCETKRIEELQDLEFDYVFICRSDCWSPPHLDTYFESLWVLLSKFMPISLIDRVHIHRTISELPDVQKEYARLLPIEKDMRRYNNATCLKCNCILPEGNPTGLFCYACSKGE